MATDPLPPDAQPVVTHTSPHLVPLPTVWTLLRYIAAQRARGLWAAIRPHRKDQP